MHYDSSSNSLLFTDFLTREIHRFDFVQKKTYTATIENNVETSFIIPVEGTANRYIVCGNATMFEIEWNGRETVAKVIRDIFSLPPSEAGISLGLAKISPSGQLYDGGFQAGMCSSKSNAALYLNNKPIWTKFKVSGAFDWNVKKNLFYVNDPCNKTVIELRWDPKTGNLGKF